MGALVSHWPDLSGWVPCSMTFVIWPFGHTLEDELDHLKSHDGPERLSLVAESSYTQHEVQGDASLRFLLGPSVMESTGSFDALLHRMVDDSASSSRLSSC